MFSQSPPLHLPTTTTLHHHPTTSSSVVVAATRRSLLLSSVSTTTTLSLPSPPPPPPVDTTITDRVYLNFTICPTYFRPQAQPNLTLCPSSQPMGRIILGLYGKLVPITVSNFKSMCTGPIGSSYKNSVVHKILPGQYFLMGRQGKREVEDVKVPLGFLARNVETVDSRAFVLGHDGPGVVSLCLEENDDDDEVKSDPGYRNVEFLITTGPGPCPELDGKNIVFGHVLEGLDVVTAISAVPTFKPAERIRQFNELAEFIGDDRAQMGRTMWNRPLKTVYISDCGELMVTKPSLSPSLP